MVSAAERPLGVDDRDRGTPRGATPPTPPGIRVTYLGGSIELSFNAQYMRHCSRAFGLWRRHDRFGPRVAGDRGFTPFTRCPGPAFAGCSAAVRS